MKRAWDLSHAWDWWRADCSRRLVMGSLRRVGEPGAAEREEGGAAASLRLVTPSPNELAGLGLLVSFPATDAADAADSAEELPSRPAED